MIARHFSQNRQASFTNLLSLVLSMVYGGLAHSYLPVYASTDDTYTSLYIRVKIGVLFSAAVSMTFFRTFDLQARLCIIKLTIVSALLPWLFCMPPHRIFSSAQASSVYDVEMCVHAIIMIGLLGFHMYKTPQENPRKLKILPPVITQRYRFRDELPEKECSICLNQYGNKILAELPCRHVFHSECIKRWAQNYTTCPYCRFDWKLYRASLRV
jgi:hypothetical protein